MHAHFSGDMGKHFVSILQFHPEHGIRERFYNRSFQHNRIFLWLRQVNLLDKGSGGTVGTRETP